MQHNNKELIFRCIRIDEDPEKGIFSKKPDAEISIEQFVKNGTESRYVREDEEEKNIDRKNKDAKSYNSQYVAWTTSLHVIKENLFEGDRFVIAAVEDLQGYIPEKKFWTQDKVKESIENRESRGLKPWKNGAKDICLRYMNASREIDIELKENECIRPENLITVSYDEFQQYSKVFTSHNEWFNNLTDQNDYKKDMSSEGMSKMIDCIIEDKINNKQRDFKTFEEHAPKISAWGYLNYDMFFISHSPKEQVEILDELFYKKWQTGDNIFKEYDDFVKEYMGEEASKSFFEMKDFFEDVNFPVCKRYE